MSKFIRIFACLFTLIFVGSAYGAGYTCDSYKKYTSCKENYYMTKGGKQDSSPQVGNACTSCPSGCKCAGGTAAPVCGTSCAAGTYWNGSSCAPCTGGNYCPGFSNVQNPATNYGLNACPNATDHKRANGLSSAPFYNAKFRSAGIEGRTGLKAITECTSLAWYNAGDRAGLYEYVKYNSSTGKYENTESWQYMSAAPGWYLKNKGSCGAYAYYTEVAQCEAGYYCPGKTEVPCYSDIQPVVHTDTFGREVCPAGKYCPAGASAPTDCPAGTYRSSTGGTSASSCTACAVGSYSSKGATSCTACSGGKTTTTTGQSSCNATCTNATGASTWITPTWSANSVTNKCAINTCSTGYTRSGTASSTGTSSYTCSANCNSVTLNATTNGGSANTTVYKRTGSTTWYSNNSCSTAITSITKPTKTNATYAGHYNTSANSGGTACVTSAGVLSTSTTCNVTGNATFYARYNCNTGWTNSGTTIAGACTANCIAITLNNTQNGGTGGTTTLYKRVGSTTIYSDSSCSTALTLSKPTKTNAAYAGHYNTTAASSGTQCITASGTWSSSCNPTTATTYYAQYTCNTGWTNAGTRIAGTCTATCNTITLNATQNGGSGTATTLYKKTGSTTWYSNNTCTTSITTLSSKPTKPNALYAGHYNTNAASGGTACVLSTGKLSTSTICNVTGTTTFYPQFICDTGWTASGTRIAGACTVTTNTITLVKNGGTGTCGGLSGTTNGTTTCKTAETGVSLPSWNSTTCNITNGNKIFKGWSTSDSATSGMTSITCPSIDTIYYAVWATPTCSAANGTCAITTPSGNAPRATITCNTGYSQTGGSNRTTSFTVTGSVGATSVSGSCSAMTSTVSFNLNGGSGNLPNNVTATYGSNMPALSTSANPTRSGYTFGGWYDTSAATGGTQYYNTSRASVRTWNKTTASVILYARWTPNEYTITYKAGTGGSGTDQTQSVTFDSSFTTKASNTFTKANATFAGWSASSGNYPNANTSYKYVTAANITLTATWNCNAGYTLNSSTGACNLCGDGTYKTAAGNGSCSACSDLSGVSVTGGKYTSVSPRNANTTCRYKAATPTKPEACATKTSNTISYSGSAWGSNIYSVTANPGAIIQNNNTATATCATCANWTYSAGGTETSCKNCPTATTGWTKASGTGWSGFGSCKQSQKPANCASGAITQTASSATAWGASSVTSALTANSGYYVNGTMCSACRDLAGGFYPNSVNGNSGGASACKTDSLTGQYVATKNAESATDCGGGKYKAAHQVAYGSTSSCATAEAGYFAPGPTSSAQTKCVAGSYSGAGASKCEACGAGKTSTAGATSASACTSCSAIPNLNTWATTEWNPNNTMSNLCTVGTCNGASYKSGNTCPGCPGTYTANTATGKTAISQCQVSCGAGTAVQTTNGACEVVPSGYQTGTHKVAYGSKTPTAADSTSPTAGKWYSCLTNYSASGTTAADHDARSDCKISCGKGTRIATANATSCTTPTGNWWVDAHIVSAGSTSTVNPCNSGYSIGGTTAADHGAAANCKISCAAGYYIPAAGGGCKPCTGGKYCNGGSNKAQTETLAVSGSCPAGTYSTGGAKSSACTSALTGYTAAVCATDKYSGEGSSSCSDCATAKGYHNSGSSAANHAGIASCKASCAEATYVATAGAGCVTVGGGYWGAGGTVAQNATLGRNQCPVGYRDGAAASSEAGCAMNVAGGKYVAVAKEATASGTCAPGTSKAAHAVTYGLTSSCVDCTGNTYSESTGASSCTACPTATNATDVTSYGYWVPSGNKHTTRRGCNASFKAKTLDHGSIVEGRSYCYIDKDSNSYGLQATTESYYGCYAWSSSTKCSAGYYAPKYTDSSVTQMRYTSIADMEANICLAVGAGYWSAANDLARTACASGLTTIGYGAGADESGDCGRVLHIGDSKVYLRSAKKTTPSLNVKIGDKTFYGNMSTATKGKLRINKDGTKYSVHDDSM